MKEVARPVRNKGFGKKAIKTLLLVTNGFPGIGQTRIGE